MGYLVPVSVLSIAVALGGVWFVLLQDLELPSNFLQDSDKKIWGLSKDDKTIRPYQLNVSQKVLTDLRTRLKLEKETLEERIVDPLEGTGFRRGASKAFLKKIQAHWLDKYDWKQREALLNKYPHFKTVISGLDIHFQHVKPAKSSKVVRPLLLLHGWPGSFVEYQKIIQKLIAPKDSDVAFELVIPSLPGFGLSEAPRKPGMGPPEIAQLLNKLMFRLGHKKFYVQGGDWGSIIASDMAAMYPDSVLGAQITMCLSLHPRSLIKFGPALLLPDLFLDKQDSAQFGPLLRFITNNLRESGYVHSQGTKPDTLGVGLSFSPSALAAHILEKFSFWTNENLLDKEDGGIFGLTFDIDNLLDNVMVHWVGKSTTSFLRLYAEMLNPLTSSQFQLERVPVKAPTSCRNYPHEMLAMPEFVLTEKYQNLVRFTRAEKGGHFSSFEMPDDVAQDIIESVKLMEKINQEKQKQQQEEQSQKQQQKTN